MSLPPLTRRAFGAVSALSAAAVWAPAIGVRAQTDGAALGRVTVAVGGQGVLYHLPLALADALGYFRLEGLDVVVRDYSAGALAWQAVQDGAADVCSGAFEHVLRAQARGHAYRALVVQGRAPQLALGVSLRSVPAYKDLGDLAGRKVGVSSVGSSTHLAASLMLMRAGVPLREVSFVGVGSGTNAMNALRSGQVQALCHADPIMTLLEQKADTRIVGDLRSLKAAIGERMQEKGSVAPILYPKAEFTPEMRGTFTILAPEMSPIHFPLIRDAVRSAGYNVEVLPPVRADIDTGLSFVNNDACYPAIITIGSLMRALLSGTYDLSRTAVILSQTGGACRASNYIGFLHKALDDAGLSRIPVISLNTRNLEPQSGFRLTFTLIRRLIKAAIYGDALQQCLYRTRPYEKSPGSAETLYRKWQDICCKSLIKGCSFHRFAQNISHLVKDFDRLPLNKMERRPRIGIVGEIYVKFSPIASNDIVRSIEANGGEAETSGMLDFFLYGLLDSHFQWKHLDGTFSDNLKDTFGRYLLEWYRRPLEKAVKISKRFHEITNITRLAKRAARFLSLGNRAGEGWFLTADMTDLLHHGCRGIICLQPFGCLPNHITGEGMIHKLHMAYPEAVFLPLDCDASASEANQENRLKLMMNSLTEKETHEKTLPFIRNTISARKGKVL